MFQASKYKDGTGSLTDYSHVWILPSYYNPNWWEVSEEELKTLPPNEQCSNDDMKDALTSALFVGLFNYMYLFGSQRQHTEHVMKLDVVCEAVLLTYNFSDEG